MMDEMTKKTLERTLGSICRHLEDLNDEIDQNGGRISDPKVLDGIKDSLTSLDCLNGMMDGSDIKTDVSANMASTAKAASSLVSPTK